MTTSQRSDLRSHGRSAIGGVIVGGVAFALWLISDDGLLKTVFLLAIGWTGYDVWRLAIILHDVRMSKRNKEVNNDGNDDFE